MRDNEHRPETEAPEKTLADMLKEAGVPFSVFEVAAGSARGFTHTDVEGMDADMAWDMATHAAFSAENVMLDLMALKTDSNRYHEAQVFLTDLAMLKLRASKAWTDLYDRALVRDLTPKRRKAASPERAYARGFEDGRRSVPADAQEAYDRGKLAGLEERGPRLGFATNENMLHELKTRGEVHGDAAEARLLYQNARALLEELSPEWLAYSTVDRRKAEHKAATDEALAEPEVAATEDPTVS